MSDKWDCGLVERTSHYILLDKNNVSDFCMCCARLCLFAQLFLTLCNPMDCSPPGSSAHAGSPGKNTGVGCYVLLQVIFTTQGLNPRLLHCRWIIYCWATGGSFSLLIVMLSTRNAGVPPGPYMLGRASNRHFPQFFPMLWQGQSLRSLWLQHTPTPKNHKETEE